MRAWSLHDSFALQLPPNPVQISRPFSVNTVIDFRSGLDRKASAEDRTLVDGHATQGALLSIFALFFIAGATGAIWVAYLHGALLLPIAAVGIFLAIYYTAGFPYSLKALGLGDVAVFLAFGPLLCAGVAIAVRGTGDLPDECVVSSTNLLTSFSPAGLLQALNCVLAIAPALIPWSIAAGIMTIQILHCNNVRDERADRTAGVRTIAGMLGFKASYLLFCLNYVIAIALTGFGIILHNASQWSDEPGALIALGASGLWARSSRILRLTQSPEPLWPPSQEEFVVLASFINALLLAIELGGCALLLARRFHSRLLLQLPQSCAALNALWMGALLTSCDLAPLPRVARPIINFLFAIFVILYVHRAMAATNEDRNFAAAQFIPDGGAKKAPRALEAVVPAPSPSRPRAVSSVRSGRARKRV